MIFDVQQQSEKAFNNLTVNTEFNAYSYSSNANSVSAFSVVAPITIWIN